MNGTNTLAGPGDTDAALLRVKGTSRALAVALDGSGRIAALDPRTAAASAVLESALNVACCGATPIGATNCLNLGSPEPEAGYWALSETVAGLGDGCRLLGVPIVSGNVSLYNETPDGPIVPAALVGMLGLLEDRSLAVPMRWREADEIWLLGEPGWEASSLAGAEHAWRRGAQGGRPVADLEAAARVVRLLPALAARRIARGAHDLSVGGLGVALSRMAIASGSGATLDLPDATRRWPSAALHGEAVGRVLVAAAATDDARLKAACEAGEVAALRLGTAGGPDLSIGIEGMPRLRVSLARLSDAWETPF
jgi:phosphoribosylformylglycinamidine synthase